MVIRFTRHNIWFSQPKPISISISLILKGKMFCLILKECFENDILNFVIQYRENYIKSKVLKNIQAAYSKGKEKDIKMGLLTLKVPKIANSIIAYMCSIKIRFKCFIFYKYYSKLILFANIYLLWVKKLLFCYRITYNW